MSERDDSPGSGRGVTDAELAAYLDDELDAVRRREVERLIATDSGLAARLDRMAAGGMALRGAFESLPPPPEHLLHAYAAGLAGRDAPPPPAAPPRPMAIRTHPRWSVPVSAGIAALAASFIVGLWIGPQLFRQEAAQEQMAESHDNWREAIADYLALYTPETFTDIVDDPAQRRRELATVSSRLGLDLAPAQVDVPGLTLKRALIFDFEGDRLGQIAYVDENGQPVALCVIAEAAGTGAGDGAPRFEQLHGLNTYYWSRGRYGFLVAARLPADRLRDIAEQLESRFAG